MQAAIEHIEKARIKGWIGHAVLPQDVLSQRCDGASGAAKGQGTAQGRGHRDGLGAGNCQ